jgi:hypothetical protein
MTRDHTFVAKIKGAGPEQFIFVTLADDFSTIAHKSEPLSEDNLRAELREAGMPNGEISSRIEHARKHPV